ncbi:MAG: hypothetical protein SGI77_20895 [Pirellulaceae bacterium]|nr:hypothetical protein [Pirellulaceae bacterium]
MPTIELISVSQSGGQAGTEFDFWISAGSRIDEVDQLFFSHSGIAGKCATDQAKLLSTTAAPRNTIFTVSIDKETSPGLYEVRVHGRFGLSNSRTFWVTTEPWLNSSGGPSLEIATALPIHTILQDECVARQRKYYRLDLESKACVRILLATSMLDSRARLLVTLLDPHQNPVAHSEVLENHDSSIEYCPDQTGSYTLIVSDHLFRGGPEYRYAVRASTSKLDMVNLVPFIDRWQTSVPTVHTAKATSNTGSALMTLAPNLSTLCVPSVDSQRIVHDESNYRDTRSCVVPFPCLITGQFDTNTDQDWFEVSLDAKNTVAIEVISDRLGEHTDPQLIVYRVEGHGTATEKAQQVSIADDISNVAGGEVRLSSRDATLLFTPPESGIYRLMVRDLQQSDHRGQRQRYAIELRKPNPDFSAVAYFAYPTLDATTSRSVSPTIIKDGTLAVAIAVSRHDGWQGPIEIRAENLPPGVHSPGLVLASDQTNGHLILVAESTVSASVQPFSIHAKAMLQDVMAERVAIPIEVTWGAIETQKAPVARLTSSLMLAVEDRDQAPLKIVLGSNEIAQVERGSNLKIPIAINRTDAGKQAIVARLRNAPPKTKANDLTLNGDVNSGELELNVPNDAPLGEYTLWAQCETKVKIPLNIQSLERAQKRLDELELKRSETSELQLKKLESAIESQIEEIKKLQELTKVQEFTIQQPCTATRIRIVEKP